MDQGRTGGKYKVQLGPKALNPSEKDGLQIIQINNKTLCLNLLKAMCL